MKRSYLLILFIAVLSAGCSKKEEPDLLARFSGTWVYAEKLNDATWVGDAQTILTIKKTTATTASVDYLYKTTGLYTPNRYNGNFTVDGSMGIFTAESGTLVGRNVLMNTNHSLVFTRNGTPVTSNYKMVDSYTSVELSLTDGTTLKVKFNNSAAKEYKKQ